MKSSIVQKKPPLTAPITDESFNKRDWQNVLLLAVLAACAFFPFLGSFGIFDPSDGWYSEGAREMLEIGNFITPHLNYQPWHEKPILTYWLIIASYKLFGVSEFAARVPSALCACWLVIGTYLFSRQFVLQRASLLASIILVSSPLFLIVGHFALTDMPLACFSLTSVGLLFTALKKQRFNLLYLAYVFCGLAVLTKGPIALFLIGIGPLLYLATSSTSIQQFVQSIWKLKPILGLAIVLAVALPWYITNSIITHGEFPRVFFGNQSFDRVSGKLGNIMPFWFYLPIVFGGVFPWCLTLFGTVRQVISEFKYRLEDNPRTALTILCTFVTLAILFFFSCVPSKLPTYVLGSVPPIAILLALYIDKVLEERRIAAISWTAPTLILLSGGAPFILMWVLRSKAEPFAPLLIVISILVACFIGYAAFLSRKELKEAIVLLSITSIFGSATLVPAALIIYQHENLKDFQDLVRLCREGNLHPDVFTSLKPSAAFYAGYAIPAINDSTQLIIALQQNGGSKLLLIADKKLPGVQKLGVKTTLVAHRGQWSLVKAGL